MNGMRTYWDLEEHERAALTDEQLERFLQIELMEKGVAVLPELNLVEVPEVKVPTRTFFRVTYKKKGEYSPDKFDPYFKSMEEAQAFIDLKPLAKDSEWRTDAEWVKQPDEYGITPVELPTEANATKYKELAKHQKDAEATNKTRQEEYDRCTKERNEATADLRTDYMDCQSKLIRFQQIKQTFDEYVKIAEGNMTIAWGCLRKGQDEEDIQEANEWLKFYELVPESPALTDAPREEMKAAK